MLLELAALSLLGLGAGLIWLERQTERRISAAAAQLERTAALQGDLRWWVSAHSRLSGWQEQAEASIDGGARVAQALHRGIAAIPFDILEAIPVTRDTSRLVRGIHDFTADNVYAAVSAVNRLVGAGSRRALAATAPAQKREAAGLNPAASEHSPADDPSRNDH